ncbi:hypothetical protein KUV28_18370 [Ferrimonas balearica]|nr:hypothetical protein [Ferrimonas balearica]
MAIVVLSIGTTAAFQSFSSARQRVADAPLRLHAEQVALNRAAEIRAVGLSASRALPSTVLYDGREYTLDLRETNTAANFTEFRIRAFPSAGGPGALLVAYVPPDPGQDS